MEKLKKIHLEFQNSKLNQTISRSLFSLMILMQIIVGSSMLMSYTFITDIYFNYFLISMPFLVIGYTILFHEWEARKLHFYLIVLVLIKIVNINASFQAESFYLLASMMMINNEKSEWILKNLFRLFIVGIGLVLAMYFLNIIPTQIHEIYYARARNSLGFWHPNTTSGIYLIGMLLYLGTLKDKVRVKGFLILSAGFLVVSYFANMPFALIIFLLALAFVCFVRFFPRWRDKSFKISLISFNIILPLLALSSYVLAVTYNPENSFLFRLNQLLGGRLAQGSYFVANNGINLFGRNIGNISIQTLPSIANYAEISLDNGYLFILLTQGMIYFVLIILALMFVVNKLYKQGYVWMPLIGISLAFWGFIDHAFMRLPFAVFLLLIGTYVGDFNLFKEQNQKGNRRINNDS